MPGMENWVTSARKASGLSPEDCASAMGCSRTTYMSRENNPGNLTISEMRVLKSVYGEKSRKIMWTALRELHP